jgi:hypothetical protein
VAAKGGQLFRQNILRHYMALRECNERWPPKAGNCFAKTYWAMGFLRRNRGNEEWGDGRRKRMPIRDCRRSGGNAGCVRRLNHPRAADLPRRFDAEAWLREHQPVQSGHQRRLQSLRCRQF